MTISVTVIKKEGGKQEVTTFEAEEEVQKRIYPSGQLQMMRRKMKGQKAMVYVLPKEE